MRNGGLRRDAGGDDGEGAAEANEDGRGDERAELDRRMVAVEEDADADDLDAEAEDLPVLVAVRDAHDNADDNAEDAEREGQRVVVVRPVAHAPVLRDVHVGRKVQPAQVASHCGYGQKIDGNA